MTVFFLFTSIWYVPGFTAQTSAGTKEIIEIGAVLSIAFSIFLITYSYNHFFKNRTKEIGILLSYGLLFSDIKKMIFLENTILYLGAVITAFISGSVFSRLFFLLTTNLLGIENIRFTLTYKSFFLTIVSFIPLYVLTVVITIFKVKKYSVTTLLKINKVYEKRTQGNKLLALLGLVVVAGSIAFLNSYTSDSLNAASMKKMILLSIIGCVLGVLLFISHLSSILYTFWKNRPSLYYRHILPLSEFAGKFSRNRSIMFIVCLLSSGIILFTTLTYTLYTQSYEIASKEQWFDVMMKDYDSVQLANHMNMNQALKQTKEDLSQRKKLSVVYLDAPEIMNNSWRTNKRVMAASVQNYNHVFASSYKIKKGEARVIDFNSSQTRREYFKRDILLENKGHSYSFFHQGTNQEKLFDRYVFSQPVMILLNDVDFKQLSHEGSPSETGSLYLFKFKNWLKSNDFVDELKSQMTAALAKSNKDDIKEIQKQNNEAFIVHAKFDRYIHIKEVAGFSLFIMSFISILFMITICVVLYFKIFTEQEEDNLTIKTLQTVGTTSEEIKKFLASKLKLIMVLPITAGSLIGLFLSIAVHLANAAEMEISNRVIFTNGLMMCGLYFVFLTFYYLWLKINYQRMFV
jgi:hypothetical protein